MKELRWIQFLISYISISHKSYLLLCDSSLQFPVQNHVSDVGVMFGFASEVKKLHSDHDIIPGLSHWSGCNLPTRALISGSMPSSEPLMTLSGMLPVGCELFTDGVAYGGLAKFAAAAGALLTAICTSLLIIGADFSQIADRVDRLSNILSVSRSISRSSLKRVGEMGVAMTMAKTTAPWNAWKEPRPSLYHL